ncbi:MAG: hypothetical protein LBH98_07935 [Chitinispirillales bacterium]|nr:hypothetical protein [Chitinispirillales bacterium]
MAAAICVVTVSYFEIDRYGNSAEFIMKILFVAIAVFAVSYAAMGQDATKREWLLAISCFLGILTVCCKELFFKSVKVKESKDG